MGFTLDRARRKAVAVILFAYNCKRKAKVVPDWSSGTERRRTTIDGTGNEHGMGSPSSP